MNDACRQAAGGAIWSLPRRGDAAQYLGKKAFFNLH